MYLDTTEYIGDDYALISNSPQSPYNFPNIAEKHFAEQLTRMDRVSTLYLFVFHKIAYS